MRCISCHTSPFWKVCVYVCVCVWERERETHTHIIKVEFMLIRLCLLRQNFQFPCLRQTYVQRNRCASDDVQTTRGATRGGCITLSSTNLWRTSNSCTYAISQPHVMTSHSYVSSDVYVSGFSEHLPAICKSGHDIMSRIPDIVLCTKRGVLPQQKLDTISESQKHSLREVTEFKTDLYSRSVNKLARSEVLTMVIMNIDVLWNIWTFIYPDDEGTWFIWNVGTLFTTTCFRWQYLHYQTVLSHVTHFRDHISEDAEGSYSHIRYISIAYIILVTWKGTFNLADPRIDGSIILKWMFKEETREYQLDSCISEQDPVDGFCENETLGFVSGS